MEDQQMLSGGVMSGILSACFWLALLVNLVAISLGESKIELVSKALLMPTLALFLWSSRREAGISDVRFLLFGLILAFVGDILLAAPENQPGMFFLSGMSAFLLMHVLLIKHYLKIRALKGLSSMPNLPIMFLVFAVAVVLIDVITASAPRNLFFPLIVFGMTLATSTGMSAQAFERLSRRDSFLTVSGAGFVMASDALLGLGLGSGKIFTGQPQLVMLTCGAGMFLIVSGTIATLNGRHEKTDQESGLVGVVEEDARTNQAQTS